MKRLLLFFGALLLAIAAPLCAAQTLPAKFDPHRDAAADVATAVAQARAQGKRVLVDVGGEWCPWCHLFDHFMEGNDEARRLRDTHYVWVKVNWSPENKNEQLLSRWPKVSGYPHLFVLDGRGQLVHSQNTAELEEGKGYNAAKVVAFLRRYAE
jgi:thiol:disulfide interchange protein